MFSAEKTANLEKKDKKDYVLQVDIDHSKQFHKSDYRLPFFTGENEDWKVKETCVKFLINTN